MDANKISLLEFLRVRKCTFNIPVYQRNYDWKEKNCERLFRDIEKIAINTLNNFEASHFLGTIVYVISRIDPKFIEYVIIDGQQRITSIMLFLKALYDVITDESIKNDIYRDFIVNEGATEIFKIKLKPIESDMLSYEKVLDGSYVSDDNENNIYRNYRLFKELINNSEVSPEDLYEALYKVEIVYIQLEKDKKSENPQMIFESLNSTGLELTPADLIRNFLLMNHSYEAQKKLYKDYWIKIEKSIGGLKISEFVRDYLTMKMGKITSKSEIYDTFKEFVTDPRNNYDEEGVLEELAAYADYYSQFLYYNSKSEKINDCLKQFQLLKSTTVYPLLLSIFDDCYTFKKLSENSLVDTMKVLISYIYRRQVCGYKTNALNKAFASLIRELEEHEEHGEYSERLYCILSKKTSSSTFPRDDEFRIGFVQKDMYKSKIDKYTLTMLVNYNTKEKIELSNDVTVEHIMPQTLSPKWQLELGNRYEEIVAKYLHTIGNLTFTGYNSELSNKSFDEKKEIYAQSNIALCREICQYDNWNEKSIEKRAGVLFERAKDIWYLPEKYQKRKIGATEIEYSTTYDIMTDINVTGEKPKQLVIMDAEYNVSSWKDLLRTLCYELYNLDSAVMHNLIRHKDFSGRERYIIDSTSENMKSPFKIGEKIYIETNLSALDILNYCKLICEHYQVSDEVFFTLNANR